MEVWVLYGPHSLAFCSGILIVGGSQESILILFMGLAICLFSVLSCHISK